MVAPTLVRLAEAIGPDRDPVQAYCDLLEHKWFLSERDGEDVGLEPALLSYLALGAPAPEAAGIGPDLESDRAPGSRPSTDPLGGLPA